MMNRQSLLLLMLVMFGIQSAKGQDFPRDMQVVYQTCLDMRQAFESGSESSLRTANQRLKKLAPAYDVFCHLKSGDAVSFDGHYLFDTSFVDSLIVNHEVYRVAQRYARRAAEQVGENPRMGEMEKKVYIRNFSIKKGGTIKMSLVGKWTTHLAVVAEPYANVSLRVIDKDTGKTYHDTRKADSGMPSRTKTIEIPNEETHTIIVEIINCSPRDISCVMIKK